MKNLIIALMLLLLPGTVLASDGSDSVETVEALAEYALSGGGPTHVPLCKCTCNGEKVLFEPWAGFICESFTTTGCTDSRGNDGELLDCKPWTIPIAATPGTSGTVGY